MTSRTVSPMSCRTTLARVIGSIDNFNALTFLHDPVALARCWRFNCVDTVHGSTPPSSSSASYPCKGDIWPSCDFLVASCTVVAGVAACSYSIAICAKSRTSRTSTIVASFLHFSANCVICSLASSFFFYATDFSISTMSVVYHSSSHASSTLNMTLSLATKGSFIHCLDGSLCALM